MDEKCASTEHKEINAVSYCEECKVYMCNECSNFHSKLCYYHHWYNICSFAILPIFWQRYGKGSEKQNSQPFISTKKYLCFRKQNENA